MFEYETPLPETEAAFLFVRVNAARLASFRHDHGSAWGASEPAGTGLTTRGHPVAALSSS